MKYVVDILERHKYALEIGIMQNGSKASQDILDAVKEGVPYGECIDIELLKNYIRLHVYPIGDDKIGMTVDGICECIDDLAKASKGGE